jgi:hypothetical protein
MVKVRLAVSAFYDDETHEAGAEVPCDVEFAKRAVLFGHAQLLDKAGVPLTFEAACEALRVTADDLAATAGIRAAALADLNGG